ncbi:coated vesicle protein [Cryptosporidium ryanae]|uniref:coated vesicle protein n=1 Tax=Cryptosporidium ryanae TaxID=515981 RepID=UPI00351A2860|nr:coated vesicle protein [Cryptosporidium ryanae]
MLRLRIFLLNILLVSLVIDDNNNWVKGDNILTNTGSGNGGVVNKQETMPEMAPELINIDDLLEIDDSDESEEYKSSSKKGLFLLEWLKEMKTFIPSNQFVFDVHSRSDEYFYYEINDENPNILLGYYCTEDTEGSIHVTINNPESKRIFSKHGCEGVYNNKLKQKEVDDGRGSHRIKGTYTVIFSNHRWHDTIRVSFLVGNNSKKTSAVDKKNVDGLISKIEDIDSVLSAIYTENQYIWSQTKTNLNNIFNADTRLIFYTIIQILAIVLASVLQIVYLKGILKGR